MPPDRVDVAIVGAGAAGLTAGKALVAHGLSVLVLEGRGRIGGRAWTRHLAGGIAFDVGCEWLHSADQNSFVPIAEGMGFELDHAEPPWGDININFPIAEQQAFRAALDGFEERIKAAAQLPNDTAAAEWLEPDNPWNPLIDAVSTYVNGAELVKVSVRDTTSYSDTQVNWRVRLGYGELIGAYGSSCPVALNTEVQRLDRSGQEILLETSKGNIRASRVICTLPTNVIADEAVHFWPPLPEKISAAAGLPLGYAEKVVLLLRDADMLPADRHLFGATNRTQTGSYDLRPLGRRCVQAYFGGAFARELVEQNASIEYATDELAGLLGSGIRKKLHAFAASTWATDGFSRGSFSHALPGFAGCRSRLAAPVDDRLFFAGEATSAPFFSTAHGAYESGLRAAAEVVRSRATLPSLPLVR